MNLIDKYLSEFYQVNAIAATSDQVIWIAEYVVLQAGLEKAIADLQNVNQRRSANLACVARAEFGSPLWWA